MSDLDRLAAAFPADPKPAGNGAVPTRAGIGSDTAAKLKRLPHKWHDVLETPGQWGNYQSASEVDMALIDALVKFRFTDAEIWELLERSVRYRDRVDRKKEHHARQLYAGEIAKARAVVVPFPDDPPRRPHASNGARPVLQPVSRPVPLPQPEPWRPSTSPESFITRYVAYASQRTDAPPEAHELMAVGILSTLAGPSPRVPIATAVHGWRLNLWVCYVANSTVGRKTTTVNLAREILFQVLGETAILEWEGSPQGFIQQLQVRDGRPAVFLRDEYSGLLAQMNRGGHMAGLPQTFIRAYDGGVIENVRVRKKNHATGEYEKDVDRVENPYLSKIVAAPHDAFVQRCTVDNVLDGFLARFIFLMAEAEPRRLATLTGAILAQRDQLIEHARAFAARAEQTADLGLEDGVLDAAWELDQAWRAEAQRSSPREATAAALQRLGESVLRVAALLAIDAGRLVITRADYHVARQLAERWKQSTVQLIADLGSTEFLRNCKEVAETVQQHAAGIMLSDLYTSHRKLRKRDFDEVLQALETQEVIELDSYRSGAPGRPPTIIYPYGCRPEGEDEP